MSLKYIAPVVAIAAGRVAAQSSCSAATTTIQNAGDASALAACTTFSGSIAIATGTTDNIQLNGLRVIDGDLIKKADSVSIINTYLSSLEGINLETAATIDIQNNN